jgi:hypothetical protein
MATKVLGVQHLSAERGIELTETSIFQLRVTYQAHLILRGVVWSLRAAALGKRCGLDRKVK